MSIPLLQVGTRGVYTLTTPFDTLLQANVQYTCIGIRKLADIVGSGSDPFADYYATHNLAQDVYEGHVGSGVAIISLQSPSGDIVYVPDVYVSGMPRLGGVPYTNLVLGLDIGALPDTVSLAALNQRLIDTVAEYIGKTVAEVKVFANSDPFVHTLDDHNTAEAARQVLITKTATDYSRLIAVTAQRDAYAAKVTELENFIIYLNLPQSTV